MTRRPVPARKQFPIRGVYYHEIKGQWVARWAPDPANAMMNTTHLGYFDTFEEASVAYLNYDQERKK